MVAVGPTECFEALLETQLAILERSKFPVLVLINGVEGAGKGETACLLSEWMDPRHVITHGFGDLTDEERARPPMWRFWRALPPKGNVGLFFGCIHVLRTLVDWLDGALTS